MPQDGHDRDDGTGVVMKLIENGAEIAGGAVGGALGFLAAGPAGAAVLGAGGTAAAIALKHVGREISKRILAPRETVRVGGVIAIAAAEIGRRINDGQILRSDGFFDAEPTGRSDAVEVAESVLLKAQREPEEKKLPHMAYLLSNIAFDVTISAQMAQQLTKAAEQLTYRQLCILKVAVMKDAFGLRQADYRGQGSFSKDLYQILYECLDLYVRGYVNFGGEVAFGPTDIAPGRMTVQGLGGDLYNLMFLGRIPDEDLLPIVNQLM